MQALLDVTQATSITKSMDSSNLTDLNTEEEAILMDSVSSETSEQLFAKVRRENANLYGSINSVKN